MKLIGVLISLGICLALGFSFFAASAASGPYPPCGDVNDDGQVNTGDPVFLIAYIFRGGPAPDPLCSGKANEDGDVNVADVVYLINYIFRGGPEPVPGCCR